MELDREATNRLIELLKENVQSINELAETLNINPMFLSGFLHAFDKLGALERNNIGGTHLYRVKDEQTFRDLMGKFAWELD